MTRAFEDAAKFSDFWAPRELVAYEPVGIPLFALTLEVIVQRKKPIPPIDEFALRAVDTGLDTFDRVTGFLGLESRITEEAIVNQRQDGHLLSQPDEAGIRRLALSSRGVAALDELAEYVPERTEITAVFDRMTRTVVGTDDRGLARPAAFEHRTLRARSPVAAPTVRDISADDVSAALARSEGLAGARRRSEAEFQLVGIKKVVRADRRYRPASLLVFREPKKGELVAGVIVDGRPSKVHTQAMSELGGLSYLEIDPASIAARRGYREALRQLQGVADPASRPGPDDTADLTAFLAARQRLRDPDVGRGAGVGPVVTPRQEAEEAYRLAGDRLFGQPVRRVLAWEHPIDLEWALTGARTRVLISSPAVTEVGLGYDVLRLIEDATSRGVSVTVVVPPAPSAQSRGEEDARARLHELAGRRPGLSVLESPNADPALLWDDNWVAGSFPWLAHEGMEGGSLVAAESIVVHSRPRSDAEFIRRTGAQK